MAQIHYPYVDLTVLPEISPHVIAPHAAVVFSNDLTRIFWANGEGAKLIGTPTIGLAVEGSAAPNKSTMRQIEMAVDKLKSADTASAVMRVRLGFQTKLLAFNVKRIALPEGEQATLLVTDALYGRKHGVADMAQAAVDCLDGSSHASAVFDRQGRTVGTSSGFEDLGISQQDLKILADELSGEDDRLVKRTMETPDGVMAFGAARIGDTLSHHLIILMDAGSGQSTAQPTVPYAVEEKPNDAPVIESVEEDQQQSTVGSFSSRRAKPGQTGLGRWYFKEPMPEDDEIDAALEESSSFNAETVEYPEAVMEIDAQPPESEDEPVSGKLNDADDRDADPAPVKDTISAGGLIKTMDHTPLDQTDDGSSSNDPPAAAEPEETKAAESEDGFRDTNDAQPVRFVWEMDSSTLFTHVSDELQNAVGDKAASITGLSWQEVSWFYGLNEEKEISAVLEKGDTWSGKTVLWPIDGTDLRVPIDLSARPTFDRNRDFSGFSGFGVIRMSDAVIDADVAGVAFEGKAPAPDTLKPGKIMGRKIVRKPESNKPEPATVPEASKNRNTAGSEEQPDRGKSLSSDERSAFDKIGKKLAAPAPEKPSKPEAPREVVDVESKTAEPADTTDSKPLEKQAAKRSARKVQAPDHDVDTSILARLPIPVLVYRDHDLLFANTEFFDLTGFQNLDDLADAGGVEALFGSHINNAINDDAKIFHRDGSKLNVFPNLQRVPWDGQRWRFSGMRCARWSPAMTDRSRRNWRP